MTEDDISGSSIHQTAESHAVSPPGTSMRTFRRGHRTGPGSPSSPTVIRARVSYRETTCGRWTSRPGR